MAKNWQLEIIEKALRLPDLSEEDREQLEWTRESFTSKLLLEAKKAFRRGDDEVGLVLAKAFWDRHPPKSPSQSECVIYCRVSTESQTKGSGLSRQLQVCNDYAATNGYYVVAVFSEVWTGAENLYARHQAERMAKARGCKIVCESHDRWSRQGVSDIPPANVEMACEFERMFDEEIKKLFTPAQLYMVNKFLQ